MLVAVSFGIWLWSRREPVGHHNVNDEWEPGADNESIVAESVVDHDMELLTVAADHEQPREEQR